MDIKKKTLIVGIGVAVFVIAFSLFAFTDVFRDYDAKGYVQAVLNQKLKGKPEQLLELTEDSTEEELLGQYETEIVSYVDSTLLNGIEVNEEQKEKYVEVTKKVFAALKYKVGEAEKISSAEYRVPVTYQTTDVISRFATLLGEEQVRLDEKADAGEYRTGDVSIASQMQEEFLNNSCALLEQAYETMEFGEKQTITFTVKRDEDGAYGINNEEIMDFVEKITGIDE